MTHVIDLPYLLSGSVTVLVYPPLTFLCLYATFSISNDLNFFFVSTSAMALPNFNKVLGSKWKFSDVPFVAVSQRTPSLNLSKKHKETSVSTHPDWKSTSLWTIVGRFHFYSLHCTSHPTSYLNRSIQIIIIFVEVNTIDSCLHPLTAVLYLPISVWCCLGDPSGQRLVEPPPLTRVNWKAMSIRLMVHSPRRNSPSWFFWKELSKEEKNKFMNCMPGYPTTTFWYSFYEKP